MKIKLLFNKEKTIKPDILLSVDNNVNLVDQNFSLNTSIKELFKNYNEKNQFEEIDWGLSVGKEVW